MAKHLKILTILACILWQASALVANAVGAPPAAPTKRSPLDQMEAITAQAKNLDDFLNHPEWVNEYFIALQKYFGADRIQRLQFDTILKQLRIVKEQVPGLAARLWESTDLGPSFSIDVQMKSYDQIIDQEKWTSFLEDLQKNLEKTVNSWQGADDPLQKVQVIEAAEKMIRSRETEAMPRGLSRTALIKMRGTRFQEIHALPETKMLANYYLARMMSSEQLKDLLNSGDADLILDTLKAIANDPRKYLPNGQDIPSVVISEIKKLIPKPQKLLEDKAMFPDTMRKIHPGSLISAEANLAHYDFISIPRRFHGIWKGIFNKECAGGVCEANIKKLMPERWATVAMENSHLQFVEKNGRYLGFVSVVPGTVGDKIYANVEFGAAVLVKKVTLIDSRSGAKRQSTLYNEWLSRSIQLKPKNWLGFVVTPTTSANNAGVLNLVHKSASYILGDEILSPGTRFELMDPMAHKIVGLGSASIHAIQYGGNMVLDAVTPMARKAESLVLLKSLPDDDLNNPALLAEKLHSSNLQEVARVLDYLEKNGKQITTQIYPTLEKLVFGSNRLRAIQAARNILKYDKQRLGQNIALFDRIHFWARQPFPTFSSKNLDIRELLDAVEPPASPLLEARIRALSPLEQAELIDEDIKAILRLDPRLTRMANRTWILQRIIEDTRNGYPKSKAYKIIKNTPGLKDFLADIDRGRQKQFPFLNANKEEAAKIMEWLRKNPTEINPYWVDLVDYPGSKFFAQFADGAVGKAGLKELRFLIIQAIEAAPDWRSLRRLIASTKLIMAKLPSKSSAINETYQSVLRAIEKKIEARQAIDANEFAEIANLLTHFEAPLHKMSEEEHFPKLFRKFLRDPDASIRQYAWKIKNGIYRGYGSNPELELKVGTLLALGNYDAIISDALMAIKADTSRRKHKAMKYTSDLVRMIEYADIQDPEFSRRIIKALSNVDATERKVGESLFYHAKYLIAYHPDIWAAALPELAQVFPPQMIHNIEAALPKAYAAPSAGAPAIVAAASASATATATATATPDNCKANNRFWQWLSRRITLGESKKRGISKK